MDAAASATPNDLDALWMPFTANRQFKAAPRLLESAEGMYYRSADGRRVLDGTAGLWCVNAGHGRREIVEAISRQAARMDYAPAFQMGHPAQFELASRVAALLPGDLDHVFFVNSGSEAVDTALKIALAYHQAAGAPERTMLIGRARGYHGVGFGGLSVGGIANNRRQFRNLLGAVAHLPHTHAPERNAFSRGEPEWGAHLADALEDLVALHGADTIAAVVVEPMAGSTGVLIPPKGYLRRLREICDRHGILLIFDEVITGFGRLGASFACERFGVVPDIVTMAKGITNAAVPMGAAAVRAGDIRRHRRRPGAPDRTVPRLHLFRPSAGLRRRPRRAGRLSRRGAVRPRRRTRALFRGRRARPARPGARHRRPQSGPGGGNRAGAAPRTADDPRLRRVRALLREGRAGAHHRRHRGPVPRRSSSSAGRSTRFAKPWARRWTKRRRARRAQAILVSTQLARSLFGAAPTFIAATSPPLNSSRVGIPRTWYFVGVSGFSSMFILATVTRPPRSLASSSSVGAMALHGPHHSAQKIDQHRSLGLEDVARETGVGNLGRGGHAASPPMGCP